MLLSSDQEKHRSVTAIPLHTDAEADQAVT